MISPIQRLSDRYSFLAECPKAFRAKLFALPLGELRDRVSGFNDWRRALLAGELPDSATPWPGKGVAEPILAKLRSLGITRYTRENPEVADSLLHQLLDWMSALAREREQRIEAELERLEGLERRRAQIGSENEKKQDSLDLSPEEDPTLRHRLRVEAEAHVDTSGFSPASDLPGEWEERVRLWQAVSRVFDALGGKMGRGWDLSRAVLKHIGWMNAVRLQEMLERLPQLKEIIASLGRLQESQDGECITEKVFESMSRLEEERREVRTPHVPSEMRGIERSAEISRMLPPEAVLLGHAKLRLLWHARRAERALMTYRIEGTEMEVTQVERDIQVERVKQTPRPQRGPILAIMDTSGSMRGVPEQVAKALVLEAMRTAHAEKRRCFLYSYSGPGNIEEHELGMNGDGLRCLLDFLAMSFGGGNDEVGVLRRAMGKLKEKDWKKADVFFVSDGEWPVPNAALSEVTEAKNAGTRFHGVQIGNRGHSALHAVCDPVHVFRDWTSIR